MKRQVNCAKLNQLMDGLDKPPYPGALGQRVFDQISAQAWQMWLGHQTMLINEYRLNVIEPQARQFLENEMRQFLFDEKPGED